MRCVLDKVDKSRTNVKHKFTKESKYGQKNAFKKQYRSLALTDMHLSRDNWLTWLFWTNWKKGINDRLCVALYSQIRT